MRLFKKLLACWFCIVLFAGNALADTIEHLYTINGNDNYDLLKSRLSEIYPENEGDSKSQTYLDVQNGKYSLAYLVAVNSGYFYYYFLSDTDNQKNNKFISYLNNSRTDFREVTNKFFIDTYRGLALKQNFFAGKLEAIKNGTLSSYSNSISNTNNSYQNGTMPQQVQPQYYQQRQIISVGTRLKLVTKYTINLCKVNNNENITALLAEDIYGSNGEIIVPKGSEVVGYINPHTYTDYNRNSMDIAFYRIVKPNGEIIPINTQIININSTQRSQYEYKVETTGQNTNNSTSTNNNSGQKMSTGAKIAVGATIAALLAGAIFIAASSSGDDNSSTTDDTSTTTAYQSPEDVCYMNDIKIETNALLEITLTSNATI